MVTSAHAATPKHHHHRTVLSPATHHDHTQVQNHQAAETQIGTGSWYGPGFIGRKTATGELYTGRELTAANNFFPLGSSVQITSVKTHRTVVVRINDRGGWAFKKRPYHMDLSVIAATLLDIKKDGVAIIKIRLIRWPNIHLTNPRNMISSQPNRTFIGDFCGFNRSIFGARAMIGHA